MSIGRALSLVAVLTLAVGAFAGSGFAQDSRPSTEDISARLKARGIDVTPEQIEQGRKIMEDVRAGRQPDPEAIQKIVGEVRKAAQTRLKESLGATDEEWQVLEPKVQKVQDLMLQTQGGAIGTALARFGIGGGAAPAGGGRPEPSEVQKRLQALQDLMKNKDATAEDMRDAMVAYRDAKTKAAAELEKARGELKELVTLKQEARLVTLGILE
jgi:hypothetical protein